MGKNSSTPSLRGLVYASMMGAATAVGAYFTIQLPLIPMTLQTLFMALAAMLLGARLGALSQVVYIILGVIGLPVFAGGKAGIGVLIGPTGGFLIGFVVGAYVLGFIIERMERPGPVAIGLAVVLGFLIVYGLGVAQLSLVAKISISKAIAAGVLPFLVGDAIKAVVAALIGYKVRETAHFKGLFQPAGKMRKSKA